MRSWTYIATAMLGLASPAQAADFSGGFDLAELHLDSDRSLFIDGTFSFGDDRHSVVAKVAAGGSVGKQIDEIDGQLLYSRQIANNFSILGGIRHEFVPSPRWTYAALGVEGALADGLSVETYGFLSEKGDVTGEMKAVLDAPLAKRLSLQPRIAVGWAAQSVPLQGLESGLTEAELGLRLRYEISEALIPYVGVSHERLLGKTLSLARFAGDPIRATHFVVGMSSSF